MWSWELLILHDQSLPALPICQHPHYASNSQLCLTVSASTHRLPDPVTALSGLPSALPGKTPGFFQVSPYPPLPAPKYPAHQLSVEPLIPCPAT